MSHSVKQKPKKLSLTTLLDTYHNNDPNCRDFFFHAKWPNGYICPECGHTHYSFLASKKAYQCTHCYHQSYVLAGTVFQDSKLPLFTLILGIHLFINPATAVSAEELANQLGINRKSAQLLARKLRALMEQDNQKHMLSAAFLESDAGYIGAKSKNGKRGLGTTKVPFLMALSLNTPHQYPLFIKLGVINSENSIDVNNFFKRHVVSTKATTIFTDAKSAFNCLRKRFTLISEIIDHEAKGTLYWTHKMISNIKQTINGIYRGVSKHVMSMFLSEFEWRFNHRYSGSSHLTKIQSAITDSKVLTRTDISAIFPIS